MDLYESHSDTIKNIVNDLIKFIEKETNERVFTLRVLDETKEGFKVLIVLENTNVLMGMIEINEINSELGIRVKANYI